MCNSNVRPEFNSNSSAAVNKRQSASKDDVYIHLEIFPELLEDNGIEYVKRYNVKLSAYFRKPGDPKAKLSGAEVTEKYNKLAQREKNLIYKAFADNIDTSFNHY